MKSLRNLRANTIFAGTYCIYVSTLVIVLKQIELMMYTYTCSSISFAKKAWTITIHKAVQILACFQVDRYAEVYSHCCQHTH